MARPSIYLPKFNPAARFVVARSFLIGGNKMAAGTDFPNGSVPERRLRQLMDQRKLTQHEQAPVKLNPPVVVKTPVKEEPPVKANAGPARDPVVKTSLSRDRVARSMPANKLGKKKRK